MANQHRAAKTGFSIILIALLALSLFMYLNFTTVVVTGESMEPTYKSGAKVLSSKAYWLIGRVKKKDVVVLEDPQKQGAFIIKRVLGLSGDVIDPANWPDRSITEGEYRVPEGTVYVVGDNRNQSEDSRKFGPVPDKDIRGKVVHLGSENGPAFGAIAIVLLAVLLLVWIASGRLGSK